MAEAAVSFVLEKLADAALKKALEIYQVSDQVEPIHLELRLLRCFLRDADAKSKSNQLAKQWVKEVRDVAHKIEDAMDIFLVEVEENKPKSSGMFRKLSRSAKHPLVLAELSDNIKEIRETLTTLYARRNDFGITYSDEDNSPVPFRPTQLSDIDDSEVVGFDSEKDRIVGHLRDRKIPNRTVLSIVGIGGLGKTTLAQKIYKSAKLKGEFDCRAWLSISQKFILTKLLREILYSIEPQMKEEKLRDEDLVMELKKSLSKKRYLIVLDDVWTTDLWDRLRVTLPDTNNASRVVITSRHLYVATAADPKTEPCTPYLDEDKSLDLLFRKALPNQKLDNENYPSDLIEIAKQITKKCGQLPLALTVLGGILSRRQPNSSTWKKMEKTMDWHNEEGVNCSQVLAMSYKDLPYHLKPCFLYFASFPEDHKISAKHVTRMWIAEGFIPKDGVGTLEDKAEIYLEELVQRGLVQAIEKSWNGYCKYCSMHDFLRDLAIHEANEENFFTVFSKTEEVGQLDMRSTRRVALQFCTSTEYGVNSENTRSLLFFGQYIPNDYRFRLLRVLSIERVDMSEKELAYEKWLNGLLHLRYLGFRHCGTLPQGFGRVSFSSLENLEALEFKETQISDAPDHSLWKVPTLRHVISNSNIPFKCNLSKWDDLKNLQTLKWVGLQDVPELRHNIKLRKLGLRFDTDFWTRCGSVGQAWHMLKGLLKRTGLLVSLGLASSGYVPFPTGDTSDLPCYEKLESLSLQGKLPIGMVLTVEMFPTNLTKLALENSDLEQDPMPTLERLQSLRILKLRENSYVGEKLICSTEGFPNLQMLHLDYLKKLHHVDITKGAMPMLSQLKIERCYDLHKLPELQEVQTLKDLVVRGCSNKLHVRMEAEDRDKIKHIPSVRIEKW